MLRSITKHLYNVFCEVPRCALFSNCVKNELDDDAGYDVMMVAISLGMVGGVLQLCDSIQISKVRSVLSLVSSPFIKI